VPAANQRVLADLQRWAERYQHGQLRARGAQPPLREGERLAQRIFPVRLSRQPDGRPFEQWNPRPGGRAWRPPFRNDGTLYATSERIYLVRRPGRGVYDVHHEWAWDRVISVDIVPNWRGIAMRVRGDDRLHVVGNVFHTFLVRPNVVTLAAAWLKVQGAWVDSKGPEAFSAWLRLVSSRLATPARRSSG
jgi:hypothetical protein